MRNRFDRQLSELNSDLLEMGVLVEQAIKKTIRALVMKDEEAARRAIALEREIDSQERVIEALCLKLLLEQQPVARDLRLISAALKMITDMERIGDQAAEICEIVLPLIGVKYIKPLVHLPLMAERASAMVNESIDAFVKKDLERVRRVFAWDDEVDQYFLLIRDELVRLMRENADNASQAIDLLMIAKYFERIGDHAQNIAEWVEFSISGVHQNGEEQES